MIQIRNTNLTTSVSSGLGKHLSADTVPLAPFIVGDPTKNVNVILKQNRVYGSATQLPLLAKRPSLTRVITRR